MHPLTVKLGFDEFPILHTCRGGDVSPGIAIEGVLPNIKSIAILATNTPEEGPSRAAWLIWNINPMPVIPEGIPKGPEISSPIRAVQGRNDFGVVGYTGPCPNKGEIETYLFRVYALDIDINLPAGSDWEAFVRATDRYMNQVGEAIALYTG
ncbi:MAG: YbhB/YbcL family Raf kinase inhibitor-like protein [Methanomicrobiaceae archaeon]|uniref:Phospholipid-binding protein n=1 Tax=hydrocarbon metagenome TaxID=938273 RepID=A0A0W8FHU2_9ZZZZ|nr:YbhB/YbcL family Raf kinase inhibitor-like protein [Methanomicrobiaceae archaeon]MDD5419375.1 YbhB/YbcL family Raf kinase inhibitor-like protein [Methanomicrobiaceae archaeon]